MSVDYAAQLSRIPNKGVSNLPEVFDPTSVVDVKVHRLAKLIFSSKHCVLHTGAGISTSAGIPDFRGPRGVWTLEAKGEKPTVDISFEQAKPTFTHRAIVALHKAGYVKCVVSQNIDGLHHRSGLPTESLAELHGNVFVERCEKCGNENIRKTVAPTIGQKYTGNHCKEVQSNGRLCGGKLKDGVLDFGHSFPTAYIALANEHSQKADLSIALGNSLGFKPANQLPLRAIDNKGHLVIVNLQKTKMDDKASLLIRAPVDDVMRKLCKILNVQVYDPNEKRTAKL